MPSYIPQREWVPTSFDLADGEPVRLATTDLQIEIATTPLRIAFLDSRGDWMLREPADAT